MQHIRPQVKKRIVLHFPGFEPLDAEAHRRRYARSARQSATVWNCAFSTGVFEGDPAAPFFAVDARGGGWETVSHVHILDHNGLVSGLRAKPLIRQMLDGYRSAARIAAGGGLFGYCRHAWRFALFFLFPFLLMASGLLLALAVAAAPLFAGLSAWHGLWSLPLALGVFSRIVLPFSDRLHTLHLFADWQLAVSLARLDDADANAWLDAAVQTAHIALAEPADEYLITSHSMGSSMAAHVTGRLLEENPDVLSGKRVVFATLGGAVLQCALLRPAATLRARVGLIVRHPAISWLEVQCLTDAIHFYKSKVAEATGHAGAPQPRILFIRFKHMLTEARYSKIKRDFLRVHRQYVLGPDRRAAFDFTLMTAGPLPAMSFAEFTADHLPPVAVDGSISS